MLILRLVEDGGISVYSEDGVVKVDCETPELEVTWREELCVMLDNKLSMLEDKSREALGLMMVLLSLLVKGRADDLVEDEGFRVMLENDTSEEEKALAPVDTFENVESALNIEINDSEGSAEKIEEASEETKMFGVEDGEELLLRVWGTGHPARWALVMVLVTKMRRLTVHIESIQRN